jgi:hypothetical protein
VHVQELGNVNDCHAELPIKLADPLATAVAGGNHHSVLFSLPLSSSFLVGYCGQDNVRSVSDPMGTLTMLDRHALFAPALTQPRLEDCSFRMLSLAKIGQAMAFPGEYVVLGTGREQVNRYGNAVTLPDDKGDPGALSCNLSVREDMHPHTPKTAR